MSDNYIKELIKTNGAISVARFMSEALAHPVHGYYMKKHPFGAKGDFITAPEISQVFGELIGIWCAYNWQHVLQSKEFCLVELGPGRGTLMADLLRATKYVQGFLQAAEIYMVETSPLLMAKQQETLISYKDNITWTDSFSAIPSMPIIVIANEFFDALPIRQFVKGKSSWQERMMELNYNDEFQFVLSPFAIDETTLEIEEGVKEGAVIEINNAALGLIDDISSHIRHCGGAAIIVDYGYSKRPYRSTLQAVKNHKYHNILQDVSNADITAHVDFASLKKQAIKNNVNVNEIITQGIFLKNMGIEVRLKKLLQKATKNQQKEIKTAIERLVAPEYMGELFKVMTITNN